GTIERISRLGLQAIKARLSAWHRQLSLHGRKSYLFPPAFARLTPELRLAPSAKPILLVLSFVPDHTVPYGTVLSREAFPGTSCQATIGVVPPGRAGRHFATASSESLLRIVPEGRCDRRL